MGKYDTVLWDVDQTLLDFKASERYAVKHCFEHFHRTVKDEVVDLYSEINEEVWKRIERGEVDKKEALTGRFQALFERTGITGIEAAAFQKKYAEALGSVYYIQDDSYTLLESLKGKYRQYLVTNGVASTQRNKLKLAGFDRLVDDIFVSEEIGAPKPQKAYFEACFLKIQGFDRTRTIIVGDSLSSDILGGNRARIAACWYNPKGLENHSEALPDYEIKSLREIIPILEGE